MNLKESINLLKKAGCSKDVVEHCLAVFGFAMYLAAKMLINGHEIDIDTVALGSLLHDIGRSVTHSIEHAYIGADMLRKQGIDEKIVRVVERHIGAGITPDEAKKLGLPQRNYVPETLEEKVVCYADKFIMYNRLGTLTEVLNIFRKELGENHPVIKRFLKLHKEMKKLIGNDPIFSILEK